MRITLGDVPTVCPSAEQLQGIVDINDPCQFANSGLTNTNPAVIQSSLANPTLTGGAAPAYTAAGTLATTNTGSYLLLALVLGGLAFLGTR